MSSFHPFCWFCFHGYWFCFKLPTTPWNQCFLLLCFYGFLSIYPLLNHPFWFLLLILWILSEWEWMHTAFVTGLCTALFVPCSFVPKLLVLLLPIFVCPPIQFVTCSSNWLLNYSPPTVWIIQAPFFVFAHCSITRGINYHCFCFHVSMFCTGLVTDFVAILVVCSFSMRFMWICPGWEGCAHDFHIFTEATTRSLPTSLSYNKVCIPPL